MTTTKPSLSISRTYKIGQTDEEGIAATIGDLIPCECCGRKISKVSILSNGLRVGSECADYLTMPNLRETPESIRFYFGRVNKKADAYLSVHGYR